MPVRRLLVGVGNFQNRFLAEGLADELHTNGQAVGKTGRYGDSGQAGDVYRHGADIA